MAFCASHADGAYKNPYIFLLKFSHNLAFIKDRLAKLGRTRGTKVRVQRLREAHCKCCQVDSLDLFTPRQVCNRARQFHALRAMIVTGGQIELHHRRPHQMLTFIQQLTRLPYLPTRISALQTISDEPFFEKRWLCMFLVACTRARMESEDSPIRSPLNSS